MQSGTRIVALLCVGASIWFAANAAPAQQHEEVAITVDDLPVHGDLPPGVTRLEIAKSILATFKAKGVPEVYGFVNAKRIGGDQANADVLSAWVNAGFPLGNHTFSHLDLSTNSAQAFEDEIAMNEAPLQALMGRKDWHWFRYPYLHEGDTLEKRHAVREYLKGHGYRVAQVTLDFEDYAWNNPYARCMNKNDQASVEWLKKSFLSAAEEYISMDQKVAQQIYGREVRHVLLLHIGAFDGVMLPQLLDMLSKKGFQFVRLDEAESDPAYLRDPDAALKYGGTLLDQFMDGQHLKYPPHTDKPMDKLNSICR